MELKLSSLECGYNKPILYANTFFRTGLNLLSAPSGTGKSTLLKTIALLIKPIKGNIIFNEKIITERDSFWSDNCIILNQGSFFFSGTILDAIKTPFKFKSHKNKSFNTEETLKLLNFFNFNIEKIKNKKIEELSGGQKQRIALIRALILQPSVILLDEPTTGLDLDLVEKTFGYLDKYCKNRICLIVSHETIAYDFANRVIKIENGIING